MRVGDFRRIVKVTKLYLISNKGSRRYPPSLKASCQISQLLYIVTTSSGVPLERKSVVICRPSDSHHISKLVSFASLCASA